MDKKDIRKRHDRVDSLLDDLRVSAALAEVRSMLGATGLSRYMQEAERIGETYRYMTHYMMEGMPDEGRAAQLTDITERLRSLSDRALRAAEAVDNPGYYYSTLRVGDYRRERLSDILGEYGNAVSELSLAEAAGNDASQQRRRCEELQRRLFDAVFTSLGDDREYSDLASYLTSGYADDTMAAVSIAALTLSLLFFYDRGKMNALLDVYEAGVSQRYSARALTGIVLAMTAHPARISADPRMTARLSLWNDDIMAYSRLRQVIRVIVGTRDTERIADKMKNEVLPELMKLRPEIVKSLRRGPADGDIGPAEFNPEWEELLEKSDLSKKMQELSEMQSDGGDLLMVTFSNLKNFPFFDSAANWFLPFDARHSELGLSDEMRTFIEGLASLGGMICDSDLYSLALAAARMPETQRQMVASQMSAQMEQMGEELKSQTAKSSAPEFDNETLLFVRDLYRFFKLFRKREGFNDPFARPLVFTALPVIGDMMSDDDMLSLIGEFYFKRKFYDDSLPLLSALAESHGDDAALWEKIGFCHQHAGRLPEARDCYVKASLLKNPGPWLTNRLAYVNRRLGDYGEAARLYALALDMDPDNIRVMMNLGDVLMDSGDPAGALSHFYHANYLRADDLKIMRAIAWAELLNGDFAKSAGYYRRIIQAGATPGDHLNAGHAALLQGELKEAANHYRLSARESTADFELAFRADMPTLEGLGADPLILRLVLDNVLTAD